MSIWSSGLGLTASQFSKYRADFISTNLSSSCLATSSSGHVPMYWLGCYHLRTSSSSSGTYLVRDSASTSFDDRLGNSAAGGGPLLTTNNRDVSDLDGSNWCNFERRCRGYRHRFLKCTGQRHKRGDGMHSARTSVPCTI